ncbi:MAG: insulinase family protein [Boseongicola sp. SB0676_bin_33]|nr:insulinase family protein [Boseongicola sp. SB0676_bin_33]
MISRPLLVLAAGCLALPFILAATEWPWQPDFGWGEPESRRASILVETESAEVRVHLVFAAPPDSHPLLHYAEHLAWMNSMGANARDADRHSNAWTSDRAVSYWLSGAPEDLPDVLETLSGVFDPIDLPREFAEQERNVILREYERGVAGNPDALASRELDAVLYEGNAIAASVIGTPEEIMALDYDEARALHAVTHRPEGATLVIIGDVSEREARRALRKAGWQEPEGGRVELAPPSFDLAAPADTTLRKTWPKAAPRLLWRRVVTLTEPVQFDLLEAQTALLRDILDTNLPGGVAGPLRFDAAVARSFGIWIWPIDEDNVEVRFTAEPDRDVSLTALQAVFEETLAETAESGIPEATYSRVLNRFDGFWPDWEDEDDTARWMADYVLERVSGLREPLSELELKRLDPGLSLESTNALLRQIAGEGRTVAAFIGPEDTFE